MTTESAQEGSIGDDTEEIPPDIQALNRRLAMLEGIQREYAVTIRVVGILTQRLLAVTGGEMLVITDAAMAESPDVRAWREDALRQVVIQVAS
jgi:hypothetical protein